MYFHCEDISMRLSKQLWKAMCSANPQSPQRVGGLGWAVAHAHNCFHEDGFFLHKLNQNNLYVVHWGVTLFTSHPDVFCRCAWIRREKCKKVALTDEWGQELVIQYFDCSGVCSFRQWGIFFLLYEQKYVFCLLWNNKNNIRYKKKGTCCNSNKKIWQFGVYYRLI